MARTAGRKGRPWERARRAVLDESDICHWCGHPGAGDVDHHPIPLMVLRHTAPELANNPANLAPIHGAFSPCTQCRPGKPRNCNGEKGARQHRPPSRGSRDW